MNFEFDMSLILMFRWGLQMRDWRAPPMCDASEMDLDLDNQSTVSLYKSIHTDTDYEILLELR